MPNWGAGAKDAASYGATGFALGGPIGGAIGATGGFLKGLFTKKKPKPGDAAGDPNSPENLLKAGAGKTGALADTMTAEGQDATAGPMQYYKSLLGENPAAIMEATRPERGRVIDQYDAARNAAANFGPRGGGSNLAQAQARTAQATQLGDITSTAKREAAGAEANLGTTLSGLGLTAKQLQSQDLNSVLQAVLTREGFDIEKRGQTQGMIGSLLEAGGTALGTYLGSKKAST